MLTKWTAGLLLGLAVSAWLQVRAAAPPATKPAETSSQTPAVAGAAKKDPAWAKAVTAWQAKKTHDPADNSYCYVCHLTYQQEELAKTHQAKGVGCETCHGMSDKHSEDEDNLTPPEIMYPKKSIFGFCLSCHEREKMAKIEDHYDTFTTPPKSSDTCTDCHGDEHRMKVRTRKWDKETGKVLWYDGVRMMQKGPAGSK